VNAISAGPIRTLAASGIGDFKSMLKMHEMTAPLKRNTTQQDVAGAALYLLSNLSAGVTGEIHYVDSGYNIMGMSSI
jgi:enoyl-[acyl-carrier protein] reductase I